MANEEERTEQDAFEELKIELNFAFSAPESSYRSLTAAEVIERNKRLNKVDTSAILQ